MNPRFQVFALAVSSTFLLAVPSVPLNAQQTFELDNAHSSLVFSVSHFKIGYIYGRFNSCGGEAVIDSLNPDKSLFRFMVKTDSVDTNNVARDKHLQGEDFFASDSFPMIEFASASVAEKDGTYTATGTMKMHGIEKEMTIPLQLLGVGKGPQGKTRIGMLAKFTLKRSDFEMDQMLDSIGDDIAITFAFEAVKKE